MEDDSNLEDFTLVWLDIDCQNKLTKTRLRTIINFLKTFDNPMECLDYISSAHNEKIFFIVSGTLGETFLPLVHGMSQIVLIYLFCTDQRRHEQWSKSYSKIHGIFTNREDLCSALMKDVKYISNSSPMMISFGPSNIEHSVKDLTAEQGTFFWFQLLIDTLLRIPQTDNAKKDFLATCRLHYDKNVSELAKIDEFDKTYQKNQAIFWYTRDSFLYRLLNRAFRTENIDIIFKFRFFMIDLYNQLRDFSINFIQTLILAKEDYLIVYRGQQTSAEELQRIRDNIGRLISMNTFLSTTTDRQIAVIYAGNGNNRPFLEPVLFKIMIDLKTVEIPAKFANIKNISYFNDEDEVLLSMATVFTVESIEKQDDEDIWEVCLKLSYNEDQQVKILTQYLKMEMDDRPTEVDLGDLFLNMTDYQRAEHYCKLVINECQLSNDMDLMKRLYGIIGISYMRRQQLDDALDNFNIVINILYSDDNNRDFDFITLGVTYNNIGMTYRYRNNWTEALVYYDRALDAYSQVLTSNHPLIATVYNNISMVNWLTGSYDQALNNIQKALDIRQQHLPELHPLMADTYGLLGGIYKSKSDYKLALYYYTKTLESREKCLPTNNILILDTYKSIGDIYIANGKYNEALIYFTKILEARGKSLTTQDNSTLGGLLLSFANVYLRKGDEEVVKMDEINASNVNYKIALDYCQKAAHLLTTINTHNYMAVVNIRLGDHQAAFRCLEMDRSTIVGSDHVNLGVWYNNMGKVFILKREWEKAQEYYQEALNIYSSKLTSTHYLLSRLYYNMGEMYEEMNQAHLAQKNYKQAYDINSQTFPPTNINMLQCKKALDRITKRITDSKLEFF
ncbi:unnamed protein product [Didymodactylos carnosus]|uniref:NAD(P)(+)--arginine ADP-ribosyltransferase n=1 Tax=Didymodactylos carnosus TaxID=1234261 RepID=A0A814ISE8_9BILA|nr:unnamed protein product [Didymodactylos carnosus]CAF3799219.1 unnamed protein product [Didymodactylos carnosus]